MIHPAATVEASLSPEASNLPRPLLLENGDVRGTLHCLSGVAGGSSTAEVIALPEWSGLAALRRRWGEFASHVQARP